MKTRAKWSYYPNENMASLHVDILLWNTIHIECNDIKLNKKQEELATQLVSIHGVIDTHFSPYSVRIHKGDVFTWNEIRPKVEQVFASWANTTLDIIPTANLRERV